MAQDMQAGPQEGPGTTPAPPTPAPEREGTNGLALTAMILGLVALVLALVPLVGAIGAVPLGLAAIVTGFLGRSRAKALGGSGLALTGIVTGAAAILVAIVWGVLAGLVLDRFDIGETVGADDPGAPAADAPAEEAPAEDAARDEPAEPVAGIRWTETLDGELWFEGMHIRLTEAELAVDDFGAATIVLHAEIENLTDDTVSYLNPGDYWLETDGALTPAYNAVVDPVPAGGVNRGSLEFPVEEDATLATAVLYAGSEDQQRAVVPLGDVGELVDGAPYDPGISGSFDVGDLTLDVTGAEVRTYGRWNRQLDADTLWLELRMDITYHGDERFGGRILGADHFRLVTPDGRTAAPIEAPIGDIAPGTTERDAIVAFEIDDPPEGGYTLTFVSHDGVEGDYELEL